MTDLRSALQPGMQGEDTPRRGDNAPQPIRSLRDWLDHLAARDRLVIIKPGVALRFELAAIAKRLDGLRATLFPRPGGHAIPVVSGLISDRGWMAQAMAVEPDEVLARYQDARCIRFPGAKPRRRRRRRSCIVRSTSHACFRCRYTTSTTAAPI